MTFDPTKPVQTRSGLKARIVCTDAEGDYPIVALIRRCGNEYVERFTREGYLLVGDRHDLRNLDLDNADLINVPPEPERFTFERWVDIYRYNKRLFPSNVLLEDNRPAFRSDFVGTVKVTISGEIDPETGRVR